jgi:DNA (cytosine-5)-methyltransferase 1
MGLFNAGFEVEGVDIEPQPHYPFQFHHADALTFGLRNYDFIWASPPCQRFTEILKLRIDEHQRRQAHLDLIDAIRWRLVMSGIPYVIENVPAAPLHDPIKLCGAMFGLGVLRHRHFESNLLLRQPAHVPHKGTVKDGQYCMVAGNGGAIREKDGTKRKGSRYVADWRRAMGIDWMLKHEITQAIPPAYSEFLGKQVLAIIERAREEAA